ncbi:MAG: leucine-rich repeat domain-containing protein [Oscillospiraceae bacterium]|nr:leucine-rich repeat domain-containing protein [Oscillospiraceae bacterium]
MKKLAVLCASVLILFSGCASKSITQEPEEPASPTESELPENASYDPDSNTVYIFPTTEPPEETIIPDSVDIDAGATSLDSLKYEVFEDRAVITDFTGKETDIVVPSHIGSYPVTEIGHYAFEAAWDVTSITIPDSVMLISEQAFADCESLTDITIPGTVTTIGRGAFSNCISLSELTIPASVTDTQEEMLTGCALQDLYILNPTLIYNNWGLEDSETKCTIHAPAGSAMLDWAEAHDFPAEEIS